MMKINKNKKGQAGFVVTVELLLIVTLLVFGMLAGWAKLRDQTVSELQDLGSAIGSIDQSYDIDGHIWTGSAGSEVASFAGFAFTDNPDLDGGVAGEVGGDGAQILYNPRTAASTVTAPTEADTLY